VPPKHRPAPNGRIPVAITVTAEDYQFICSCIRRNDGQSFDELIAAALATFREHLLAFMECADDRAVPTRGLTCSVTYRWTV